MAYVMTYTTLLEMMRSYLERGSVNDPNVFTMLPRLVKMCEMQVANEIKPQGFEQYVTFNFQASVYIYPKPALWRETRSMRFGTNLLPADTGYNYSNQLFSREYEYCRAYWPNSTITSTTEIPRFYGEYGPNHIIIAPTPAVAYPVEWAYWAMLQPLDEEHETNWLTQYAPHVLLYGSLLQATPYLGEDERIPVWQGAFDRAVAGMLRQDARKAQDAATKPEEGVE